MDERKKTDTVNTVVPITADMYSMNLFLMSYIRLQNIKIRKLEKSKGFLQFKLNTLSDRQKRTTHSTSRASVSVSSSNNNIYSSSEDNNIDVMSSDTPKKRRFGNKEKDNKGMGMGTITAPSSVSLIGSPTQTTHTSSSFSSSNIKLPQDTNQTQTYFDSLSSNLFASPLRRRSIQTTHSLHPNRNDCDPDANHHHQHHHRQYESRETVFADFVLFNSPFGAAAEGTGTGEEEAGEESCTTPARPPAHPREKVNRPRYPLKPPHSTQLHVIEINDCIQQQQQREQQQQYDHHSLVNRMQSWDDTCSDSQTHSRRQQQQHKKTVTTTSPNKLNTKVAADSAPSFPISSTPVLSPYVAKHGHDIDTSCADVGTDPYKRPTDDTQPARTTTTNMHQTHIKLPPPSQRSSVDFHQYSTVATPAATATATPSSVRDLENMSALKALSISSSSTSKPNHAEPHSYSYPPVSLRTATPLGPHVSVTIKNKMSTWKSKYASPTNTNTFTGATL